MNVVDLVVDTSGAVVGKSIERDIRDIGTQAAITLRQTGSNSPCRGQQGPVIGRVGSFTAIEVSAETAGQHQCHQQQREIPQ